MCTCGTHCSMSQKKIEEVAMKMVEICKKQYQKEGYAQALQDVEAFIEEGRDYSSNGARDFIIDVVKNRIKELGQEK